MTVLVIILISAPLLIFFLAAPIILIVDTETDDYCLRLGDICSLRALTALENPGVRLRIGFWKKTWGIREYLLTIGSKKSRSAESASSKSLLGRIRSGKRDASKNQSRKNNSVRNVSKRNDTPRKRDARKSDFSKGSIHRLVRVLKTFRISKCDVLLDTDDFILNAKLFPIFQYCSGRWGRWRVNFEGDHRVQLEVESRLISVLYAWWRRT